MRFMIIPQPDPTAPKTDRSEPPSDEIIAAYMKYNEDLHRAGVLVTAEGVNPAGPHARIGMSRGKRKVIDGPYTESKELVGGFYLIDVNSKEEAVEWALKCPTGLGNDEFLEILPMTNLEDLPKSMIELTQRVAPTWFAAATQSSSKK
jgi:hypothetical protein